MYISHSSLTSSQSYLHKQPCISHTVHSHHPSPISTNSYVYLTQFTRIIPVLSPQTVMYISQSSLTSSQSYLHKQPCISHTVHSHHSSPISTKSHVYLTAALVTFNLHCASYIKLYCSAALVNFNLHCASYIKMYCSAAMVNYNLHCASYIKLYCS
jgi:hypothetical protein